MAKKPPGQHVSLTFGVRPAPRIVRGVVVPKTRSVVGGALQEATQGHDFTAEVWIADGRWASVISSNVSAIQYDKAAEELLVEFRDGAIYQYTGVSAQAAQDLFNCSSIGGYIQQRVKRQYPALRLKG